MDKMRALVLFAHPAVRKSRINVRLRDAIRDCEHVTLHDLYETYPDFSIDVDREQALLTAHDVIVFQHPFYWYSAPAIVKEWLDLVLEHGFAYGRDGNALRGKTWLQAITTGGRDSQYGMGAMNQFTIEEFLRPFEATAHLCGMRWLQPFVLHAAHTADDGEIHAGAEAYRARIDAACAVPDLVLPRTRTQTSETGSA